MNAITANIIGANALLTRQKTQLIHFMNNPGYGTPTATPGCTADVD